MATDFAKTFEVLKSLRCDVFLGAHGSYYGMIEKYELAKKGIGKLVDLQDIGCRVYTFATTLRYVLEAAAQYGKRVWVLDRPNPAGRAAEGLRLRAGSAFRGLRPRTWRIPIPSVIFG